MNNYLFLNNGQLNGKQIIPQQWVEASTSKQIDANYLMILPAGYGYQWWRLPENYNNLYGIYRQPRTNDVYFAWGHGGQYVYILPEFDMVVTMTAWTSEITKILG